ncbi:hypothetical protein PVAND_003164 [Polypedilum vanderplanki]|uniref:Odorant receptor n=1 Tax=Polypedilum vanderplanki TaxID=319348 RepID=A0A9J6BT74_POLVA|nr:hypothetical protein PVAND_003164 [Polypedilum vanderplanki]
MKLSERLRILVTRIKSYFVSDQVQNFMLFLEDFFPSEKMFQSFGFTFLNRLQISITQQQSRKNIFWSSVVISLVIWVLFIMNFLYATKSENFILSVDTFGWISGYFMTMTKKFFLCYWKRQTIMKIIERLDRYFPHSSREQLQFKVSEHHRNLKILHRISLINYVWTWIHFSYMPLLSILFGQGMQLFAPIYFPFDTMQTWLYPIIFILQVWNLFFIFILSISMDFLFYDLLCVISMEFDVLAQKISQIDPESDENADKKFGEIIDGYNELIDIANELEDNFSPLLLVHIYGGIFMLCVSVFLLFVPMSIYFIMKNVPPICLLLVQLFCICFYGEQLQISSMRVADEAYNCNWYGKNLKFRKMILLTMLRAQRPQN